MLIIKYLLLAACFFTQVAVLAAPLPSNYDPSPPSDNALSARQEPPPPMWQKRLPRCTSCQKYGSKCDTERPCGNCVNFGRPGCVTAVRKNASIQREIAQSVKITACKSCHQRKVKCSQYRPCETCQRKGIQCKESGPQYGNDVEESHTPEPQGSSSIGHPQGQYSHHASHMPPILLHSLPPVPPVQSQIYPPQISHPYPYPSHHDISETRLVQHPVVPRVPYSSSLDGALGPPQEFPPAPVVAHSIQHPVVPRAPYSSSLDGALVPTQRFPPAYDTSRSDGQRQE